MSSSGSKGSSLKVGRGGCPKQQSSRAVSSSKKSQVSPVNASSLVRNDVKYDEWRSAVGLPSKILGEAALWNESSPPLLRDILTKARRIPKWMSNLKSPELAHAAEYRHDETRRVCAVIEWHMGQSSSAFDMHDQGDDQLKAAICDITRVSRSVKQALWDSEPPNEMELRTHVDSLMNVIYPDDGGAIVHRLQRSLKLPKAGVTPAISSIQPDALDVIRLPEIRAYGEDNCVELSCYSGSKVPRVLHIVHCVTEYESLGVDGERQTLMGIASAMHHRLALGFDDQLVFGIIHTKIADFRVVAAAWQEGQIVVYNLDRFKLQVPIEALRFYLLIREIKRIGLGYCDAIEMAGSNLSFAAFDGQGIPNPWEPSASRSSRHSKGSLDDVDEVEEINSDDGAEIEADEESQLVWADLEEAVLLWRSGTDACNPDPKPTQGIDSDIELQRTDSYSGDQATQGQRANLEYLETPTSTDLEPSTVDQSLEIGEPYSNLG
ncbi:hypothetical protein RhiJN_21429 [Ceratobasidium sp. AG-Ba]|nr:hypothetical protein RhiJN_21429 [Ceratobasidium sp. AG-Ba]